ncbi:hypothetical protein [Aulosira sp. FACHB-615]|uniref:hypothetical protein n=1 Tax=Aulosira sp. FACHB-615 TaxID=2692777 RepID=UPI0016871062|nr:hypothetical protein [Aulosira sp. FACHB-615]MBD2487171.1 hypothetical protein [Aulosira sp. FACHB-615]
MNYEELINDISHINNTAQTAVVRAINQIQTIRHTLSAEFKTTPNNLFLTLVDSEREK